MTVDVLSMRRFLGIGEDVLDNGEIKECIDTAEDVVGDEVRVAGGSGLPDSAVKYTAAALIYRAMDSRNIKPASISEGGISISTDVGAAVQQFLEMSSKAVKNYVNARAGPSGRGRSYLFRVRGRSRGCR